MAWSLAVELPETAQVVEGNRRVSHLLVVRIHRSHARQVKDGPEQHGSVSIRENESITVRPNRIERVEAHHTIPKGVDQRRECHRCAWVSRLGRLNRVNGEGADGVDGELFSFLVAHVHLTAALNRGSSGFQGGYFSQTAEKIFCLSLIASEESTNRNPS